VDAYVNALKKVGVEGKHVMVFGDGYQSLAMVILRMGARKLTVFEPSRELAKSFKSCVLMNGNGPLERLNIIESEIRDARTVGNEEADVLVSLGFGAMVFSRGLHHSLCELRPFLKERNAVVPFRMTQNVELIECPELRALTTAASRGRMTLREFDHYRNTDSMMFTADQGVRLTDLRNCTSLTKTRAIFDYYMDPLETAELPKKRILVELQSVTAGIVDAIMISWSMRTHKYCKDEVTTHPGGSNLMRDLAYGQGYQLVEDFTKRRNHIPVPFEVSKGEVQAHPFVGISLSEPECAPSHKMNTIS